MKITKVDIEEIIKGLATKPPRIFQREAQFQFELAWELQKKIGDDGKVLLEYPFSSKSAANTDKVKRFYSDIILKDDSGFIVIELKYKTKKEDRSVYGVELTGQGAQDEGRYDYLRDIMRIELMKKHEYDYSKDLGEFLGGYAIMLTNDNQYWNIKKEDATKKGRAYSQFCIGDGDKVEGSVDWDVEEKKDWMKSRPEMKFDYSYTFEWKDYYCPPKSEDNRKSIKKFRYLITHIK